MQTLCSGTPPSRTSRVRLPSALPNTFAEPVQRYTDALLFCQLRAAASLCAVTVLRLACVQVLWLNRGVRTAPCDVQCKHVLAHMRSCACPALSCPCVLRCRSTLRCFWPCPVACARRRCLKWSLQEVSSTHQNPLLKLSKWPLSHVLTRLLVPCSDGACPLGRRALLPKRSSPRQPSPVHAPAQGCLLPGSSAGLPGGGWRGLSWRR